MNGDNNEIEGDDLMELSGMLLNHCLLFKNSLTNDNIKGYVIRQKKSLKSDLGVLYHIIDSKGVTKKSVAVGHTYDYFQKDSQKPREDTVLWLHIVSPDVIESIFGIYQLPHLALKCFLDNKPQSYIQPIKMNGDNNQIVEVFMSLVTLFSNSNIIHTKMLKFYVTEGLIITFEESSRAELDFNDDITARKSIDPLSERGSVTPMGISREHSFNRGSFSNGLMRTTSYITGSELARDKSKNDQNMNDNKSTLNNSLLSNDEIQIAINVDSESDKSLSNKSNIRKLRSFSCESLSSEPISGVLYDILCTRIETSRVLELIMSTKGFGMIYESIFGMNQISHPVIDFIASRTLELHDKVFVREKKPGHSEGNKLKDQIDTLQCNIHLMKFIISESNKCINKNEDNLSKIIPAEYCADLISLFNFSSATIIRLDDEINRVEHNLDDLIGRRNTRIDLLLSITATLFLPLSTLTGIFGMNFTNEGWIVYFLHAKNGSLVFWFISGLFVVGMLYFLNRRGYLEMLTTIERNKYTKSLKSQVKRS